LQRLAATKRRPSARQVRTLVLTPTRELALQVAESFAMFARPLGLRTAVVFGGVGQHPQVRALSRGVDVLVATPGRLLDLSNQGHVAFDQLEVLILDEADRMLDMGFVRDVRRIVALVPPQRQTLLFSATLPEAVADLAHSLLKDPKRVEVTPQATTAERVEQRVLFVEKSDKRRLLTEIFADEGLRRVLVFARTKHGANRLAEHLEQGGISADAIHGNKSQAARQRALEAFRAGEVRALVATDIAARGIDVEGVSHVVNFELPVEPESYVHRIGRTARAGRDGIAISFCDAEELPMLRAIERAIRSKVEVDRSHPYHAAAISDRHGAGPSGHRASRPHRPGGHGTQPGMGPVQRSSRPADRTTRFKPRRGLPAAARGA
jgi:ATP-dependent RNA helicase RhlE